MPRLLPLPLLFWEYESPSNFVWWSRNHKLTCEAKEGQKGLSEMDCFTALGGTYNRIEHQNTRSCDSLLNLKSALDRHRDFLV